MFINMISAKSHAKAKAQSVTRSYFYKYVTFAKGHCEAHLSDLYW